MNSLIDNKAIFFDLDNTLYSQADDVLQRISAVCTKYKLNKEVEQYWNNLWLQKGNLYRSTIDDVIQTFSLDIEKKDLINEYCNVITKIALPKPIQSKLIGLKKKGIKIFVITNGNEKIQNSKISSLSLNSFFDDTIVSSGKHSKPDPYWINFLLNKHNINNSEAVFIGDSPNTDGKAANNAAIGFILTDYKNITGIL